MTKTNMSVPHTLTSASGTKTELPLQLRPIGWKVGRGAMQKNLLQPLKKPCLHKGSKPSFDLLETSYFDFFGKNGDLAGLPFLNNGLEGRVASPVFLGPMSAVIAAGKKPPEPPKPSKPPKPSNATHPLDHTPLCSI